MHQLRFENKSLLKNLQEMNLMMTHMSAKLASLDAAIKTMVPASPRKQFVPTPKKHKKPDVPTVHESKVPSYPLCTLYPTLYVPSTLPSIYPLQVVTVAEEEAGDAKTQASPVTELKQAQPALDVKDLRTWGVAYAFAVVIKRNMTTEGGIFTHITKEFPSQRTEMKTLVLSVMTADMRTRIAQAQYATQEQVSGLAAELGQKAIAKANENLAAVHAQNAVADPSYTTKKIHQLPATAKVGSVASALKKKADHQKKKRKRTDKKTTGQ